MPSAHLLTSEDISRWKTLPDESLDFFQKYSWSQLLSEVYMYKDYSLATEDEDGNFDVLPLKLVNSRLFGNRLISAPFSDYAGPTRSSALNQRSLLREAARLYSNLRPDYIEIRLNGSGSADQYDEIHHLGFSKLRQYTSFLIDLKSEKKEVWGRISSPTRRAIAKSEREGVEVREATSQSDLESYYKLHVSTSREHGSPAHPRRFLAGLFALLKRESQSKLLLARRKDRDIAGLLVLSHGSTAHYWQSALPQQFRASNPFHLLLWRAIELSMDEERAFFDLGRTRPGTGVFAFKRTWGGKEYSLNHFCLFTGKPPELVDPEEAKFKAASEIWRKVPGTFKSRLEPRLMRDLAL